MLGYVMVGTNNLDAAIKFYDEVLGVIGLTRNETVENDYAAYGKKDTNEIEFYITKPFNKKEATFGNGTQITLLADSKEAVDKFYEVAISKGATDEGAPGVRKDGNYYGYIRDLDGNKIAAKSILK